MRFFKHVSANNQTKTKFTIIAVTALCLISLALNLFQKQTTQACFNADEAAHGYNAYSILKTGRDEYGQPFPIRFKSFGEYKMPLYSYISIPFIAAFGLTVDSVRAPNMVASLIFPIAIYMLASALFRRRSIALIACTIATFSLGLHSVGRHAHEVYISTLAMVFALGFFVHAIDRKTWKWVIATILSLAIAMLGYQAGRIYALCFLFVAWVLVMRKTFPMKYALAMSIAVFILFIPDLFFAPARVNSLFYFNSEGLHLKVLEYRTEGGNPIFFNKATVALRDIVLKHAQYYAPQFLVERGDLNYRFGYQDMSMVNIVTYGFFLIGLFHIFRNPRQNSLIFLLFLIVAPVAGSLSWADISITRTLFLLPLIHVAAAVGIYHSATSKIWQAHPSVGRYVMIFCVGAYGFYQLMTWQIFLYHYPNRDEVIVAQQCGYAEVGKYLNDHPNFKNVYISKAAGQPYIYTLFFTKFDPDTYQQMARLTPADEYGFGQVERFGKYEFNIPNPIPPGSLVIGVPTDLPNYESLSRLDPLQLEYVTKAGHQSFFFYIAPK